jgi:hypothetical protein
MKWSREEAAKHYKVSSMTIRRWESHAEPGDNNTRTYAHAVTVFKALYKRKLGKEPRIRKVH